MVLPRLISDQSARRVLHLSLSLVNLVTCPHRAEPSHPPFACTLSSLVSCSHNNDQNTNIILFEVSYLINVAQPASLQHYILH